jgi:hypothetical protein
MPWLLSAEAVLYHGRLVFSTADPVYLLVNGEGDSLAKVRFLGLPPVLPLIAKVGVWRNNCTFEANSR